MRKITDIEIGDKVKSFDYEDSRDFYYEGTVFGVVDCDVCPKYRIQVEKQFYMGTFVKPDVKWIYPPVNGTSCYNGFTQGVELI